MNSHLQQPVTEIKGIGEETGIQLNEMHIFTIHDLLLYFPYRFEDYSLRDLAEVKHEEKITIEGKVHSEPLLTYYNRKRSRLTFRVLVGRYLITATCFNRPYYKNKISVNDTVTITGKWDQHRNLQLAPALYISGKQ